MVPVVTTTPVRLLPSSVTSLMIYHPSTPLQLAVLALAHLTSRQCSLASQTNGRLSQALPHAPQVLQARARAMASRVVWPVRVLLRASSRTSQIAPSTANQTELAK